MDCQTGTTTVRIRALVYGEGEDLIYRGDQSKVCFPFKFWPMLMSSTDVAVRLLRRRPNLCLELDNRAGSNNGIISLNLGESVNGLRFWDKSPATGRQHANDNPLHTSTSHREPIWSDEDMPRLLRRARPLATVPATAAEAAGAATVFLPLGPYQHDIRRWVLALNSLSVGDLRHKTLLADRVSNLPRFEGVGRQWPIYLGFAITGFVYGGLHCLAWNAPFATNFERLLWKLSSVTVSSTGILLGLIYTWERLPPFWSGRLEFMASLFDWAGRVVNTASHNRHFNRAALKRARFRALAGSWVYLALFCIFLFKTFYDLFVVAFIVFYCFARVYLVVESFICLTHLPESAYIQPKWSQYMPHIG